MFPLRLKSDTILTLSNFFAYVHTQFGIPIQGLQSDNGREFDNLSAWSFFASHSVLFRMSCPYNSAQNGEAECIIRTTNNVVCSLLFHASVPHFFGLLPSLWQRTFSILPTKTLSFSTPHFALFGVPPSYEHLRVFGCKCYPNLFATASHKLVPRSSLCVFLGYYPHHKGYICFDRHTNRTIIYCHVVFDEGSFPFAKDPSPPPYEAFEFLEDSPNPVTAPFHHHRTLLL
jgi:histone deacetylase 1/2